MFILKFLLPKIILSDHKKKIFFATQILQKNNESKIKTLVPKCYRFYLYLDVLLRSNFTDFTQTL